MDHLGANRRAVDVCADVESDEGGYDMGREGVAHGIYHRIFNLRQEGQGVYAPIRGSGMSPETTSHARYIDPKLCPRRMNIGQVASSTRHLEFRNTSATILGSSMSNLD